jgi:hypothetical protein
MVVRGKTTCSVGSDIAKFCRNWWAVSGIVQLNGTLSSCARDFGKHAGGLSAWDARKAGLDG